MNILVAWIFPQLSVFLENHQFMEDTPVGENKKRRFRLQKTSYKWTVIVNGETHNLITLLDERNGKSLRKWLKNNKHVKVVTRDRAGTYAKVIVEELPDVMQIADRFHLHQNLLDTIKKL